MTIAAFVSGVCLSAPWRVTCAQAVRSAAVADVPTEVVPVRGDIYMLVGYGGNVTASIGPDGTLLVDAGTSASAEALLAALRRIEGNLRNAQPPFGPGDAVAAVSPQRSVPPGNASRASIRYIVDSGPRPDHAGGNAVLAAAGLADVSVIAHESVLLRLVDAGEPFEMLPTVTLQAGQYDLTGWFNGEPIRLAHMQSASTAGDVIVHFRDTDVISTGDLFSMSSFPLIDVDRGGSIDGTIRALNFILALAVTGADPDGDTLIVPGHGRLADATDLGQYRDMLSNIRSQVQFLIDADMTLDEIQASRPALGYEGRFGADRGSWTTERFIEAVFRSLTQAQP